MRTSEQINELAAALMVVQNTVGNLPKTAHGYGYDYTPLDEVTNAIREPLAESGLAYTQMPSTPPEHYYPAVALTTRLMHVSGQWLEDTLVIPIPEVGKANEAQAYGAALTYARRYALTAMFGIAADEDTDATYKPKKKEAPAKAPAPQAQAQQPRPQPPATNGSPAKPARPLSPEAVKEAMNKKTAGKGDKPASDKQRKYAVSSLAAVTAGDNERHTITLWLFGKQSVNDLTAAECSALIDWIDYREVAPDDWQANPDAIQEAAAIIRQDAIEKGQKELFA